MEKLIKKWKYIVISFIVIVTIMIILDAVDLPHIILGGDWLGFAGAFLGSFVSIFGVYWTIQESNEQFKKERELENKKQAELVAIEKEKEKSHLRDSVYPFLEMTNTICKFNRTKYGCINFEESSGDFKIGTFGEIIYSNSEAEEKYNSEIIDYHKIRFEDKKIENQDNKNYYGLAFKIKNVGLGTALINRIVCRVYGSKSDFENKINVKVENKTDNVESYANSILLLSSPDNNVKWLSLILKIDGLYFEVGTVIVVSLFYKDLYKNNYQADKIVEIAEYPNGKKYIKGLRSREPKLIS